MELLTLLRGTTGLNEKADPARLKWDMETGIRELVIAVNVDIDHTGRISRRKTYLATDLTQASHSLFCDGGDCLFVSGDTLYKLNRVEDGSNDFARTAVRTGLTQGARMSYVQVDSKIYYANGHENGIYVKGASESWAATDAQITAHRGTHSLRSLDDPPVGHLLAYWKGRIWIAKGRGLYCTELHQYKIVDFGNKTPFFESNIRMIAPVEDGMFVSDGNAIYFVVGPEMVETKSGWIAHFRRKRIVKYPAVEGTDVFVNAEDFLNGELNGDAVVFGTKEGICIGGNGGLFRNLSKRKLDCPDADYGSGIVINKDKYICSLNP